ncbi:hypothetical protein ACJMK2_025283 [Sinanodonta woodiana]|uniref:Anti-proliferative protein domain-containing protein n=1 Tax=Sinanodonta woodiana TaxID=1069815 RepID=A0ABD3XGI7_SINWO
MKEEIAAAVVFFTRLIRQNDSITKEKADEFSDRLSELLLEKFRNHWYADNPNKGQGYRCIRVNPTEPIDPVLKTAATLCGLKYSDLRLPTELTVWVDPQEVSCRFGETQGSICMLTSLRDGNLETQAHKIDIGRLVEEQQKRNKRHINIVTTRLNKPCSQYHKNILFRFSSFPFPINENYQDGQILQYQQNFFPDLHVAGFYPFNPHSFHNNRHNIKNHNKGSFNGNNCRGYHGNKANGFNQNHRSNNQMKLANNPNVQTKAKYHWARGKQNRAGHIKVASDKMMIGVV